MTKSATRQIFFSRLTHLGMLLLVLLNASTQYAFSQTASQAPPEPTQFHQQLSREAGVWDATTRCWMSPDTEPLESTATETCEMLGGFWLTAKFEGDFAGMPFKGISQTGYDAETSEYVSTWIDSMTGNLLTLRGNYDVETHTLTLVGKGKDWMTGKSKQIKMQTQYLGEDKKYFEIHELASGSDEWAKTMEIEYVRRK